MKANVCAILFCDECQAFMQRGSDSFCALHNESIRWFQFACPQFIARKAENEAAYGPVTIKMKRCSNCGQIKPVEAFSLNASTPDGRQGWCKNCMSNKMRNIYVKKKANK